MYMKALDTERAELDEQLEQKDKNLQVIIATDKRGYPHNIFLISP